MTRNASIAAGAPPSDAEGGLQTTLGAYLPEVTAFLIRNAGDRALGLDLAQDVFARALRASSTLKDPAATRAWLYRIAVNRLRDEFRRRKREPATESLERELSTADGASPERRVLRAELADVLRKAAADLPTRQREVLLLHGVEGFEQPQIATTLGLSLGAVKTALYHAREKLRAVVETYLAGGKPEAGGRRS